jgi:CDP-2,3-bis-(O-geranylgeranyl)-sn-glycerol synthase
MTAPDPWFCALCLMVVFVFSGALQSAWLYSKAAERFGIPIDGGRLFRGQRIFGDNKTWRGFVVMVPATGFGFLLLGSLCRGGPPNALWPIALWQYGLLGCWAGLGFMAGELPNSFLKRQLKVAPGQTPTQPWAKALCFLLDQVDSVVGALLAVSICVPVSFATWIVILVSGTVVHWLFNVVLFLTGAKKRAA